MNEEEKIKEVIRYMKACIADAERICSGHEYQILKKCYEESGDNDDSMYKI